MQEIPVSLPYYAYMLYWFIHAIAEIDRCGQRIASPAIFDQQAFITKRFQYALQLPTAAMQDLDRFVHAGRRGARRVDGRTGALFRRGGGRLPRADARGGGRSVAGQCICAEDLEPQRRGFAPAEDR